MSNGEFTIRLTLVAAKMLAACPRKAAKKIADKIDGLANDPGLQGKPLKGELSTCRSVAAAGRFRVIYTFDDATVTVVAVGIRKEGDKNDIYKAVSKLAESGDLLT